MTTLPWVRQDSETSHHMQTFFVVWFGQLVSLTGSQLTSFALAVWVLQETGSSTQFALIALARFLPAVFVSPLAGVLADRWDRRHVMIAGDTGAVLATVLLLGLSYSGHLAVWHIYLSVAINAAFGVFQGPAYAAMVPLLVPKEQLGRANGLLELANSFSTLVAPILAGVLIIRVHLQGILWIDLATFLVALMSLSIIRLPALPKAPKMEAVIGGSLLREIAYGWIYLSARTGLLVLVIFYACINFFLSQVHHGLLMPMILSFASAPMLGAMLSIGGIGWLGGSLVMSLWGGSQRRIHGALGFAALMGVGTMLIGLQPQLWLITAGMVIFQFSAPIAYSSGQALLQSKVAPHVQGRVMALRTMIAQSTMPMGYLLVGPLAERVFEPMLAPSGALSGSAGRLIGTGPGRGMALLFLIMGAATILVAAVAYLYPRLRLVDHELPDAVLVDKEPGG